MNINEHVKRRKRLQDHKIVLGECMMSYVMEKKQRSACAGTKIYL